MKKIQSLLNSSERVISETKPDLIKLIFTSKFTLGGLGLTILVIIAKFTFNLSLLFLLVPVILLMMGILPALLNRHFTTYYITNEKVIIESGIIGRDYDIVKLDRVMDIKLDVTMIDTLFGTGSIRLCTANEKDALISNIRNPKELIRKIQM